MKQEGGMRSFRHIVAPLRIFQGPDSLEWLGRELERVKSRRAVIFCGASLARDGSPLHLVRTAMGDRCAGVFAGVVAHSPLPVVEAAAAQLQRLEADAVVAVGGGSAIVTARAASILLAENGDARSLCTSPDGTGELRSPRLPAAKLPQLVVPTTPTTATVKAGSAVLDPVDGKRLALFDPKTRAGAVFIHPELVGTPPRDLVVSAGLNTLAMAVEGLMSRSGDAFSDALLMHAVRLLAQHLPAASRGDDLPARLELVMASLVCGHGTDHTGAGIAIPLGHAISARFHIDNGIANAIVMPHVLRFNAGAATGGLDKLAAALGISLPAGGAPLEAVNEALGTIFAQLGIAPRLRDVGVSRESLPDLAAVSMQDWFVRDNPRPVRDASQLLQVLEQAW
jgi:alcohol dehydrogenase class IV